MEPPIQITPPIQAPPALPTPPKLIAENTVSEVPKSAGSSISIIIGIVIVILVLLIGALYFWGEKLTNEERAFLPTDGDTFSF